MDPGARNCTVCERSFDRHAEIREHHCRHCNKVVCSECSKSRMAIPKLKSAKAVRVCDACLEMLESEKRLINLVNQQRRAGQVPKAEKKKLMGVGKLQLKKPSEIKKKDGESPAARVQSPVVDPETGWTPSGKFKINGDLLIDSQKVTRIDPTQYFPVQVSIPVSDSLEPLQPPRRKSSIQLSWRASHNPLRKSDLVDEGPIGRGGSGVVRLLRHVPTDNLYACKIIILSPEVDERVVAREVEAMDDSWHYNLVPAITAFLDRRKRALHVIQEYMDGGSLEDCLKTPGVVFTENIVAAVAQQVASGLAFLHQKCGMRDAKVHRDLKPANILANTAGVLKLGDFGITAGAKTFGNSTFVGTSIYMAPERIKGARYGIESDIWSLGLTIVELLTGKCPFAAKGPNFLELFVEITSCLTIPLPASLSPDCQDFVNRCVRHEASERATVNELLNHKWLLTAACQEVVAAWVGNAVALRTGPSLSGVPTTGSNNSNASQQSLASPKPPAPSPDPAPPPAPLEPVPPTTTELTEPSIPTLRSSPHIIHKTKQVFNRLTGRTADLSGNPMPAVEAFTHEK